MSVPMRRWVRGRVLLSSRAPNGDRLVLRDLRAPDGRELVLLTVSGVRVVAGVPVRGVLDRAIGRFADFAE